MTYDDIEAYLKADGVPAVKEKLAALGLPVNSRQTLYNWKNEGVPELVQFKLEKLTNKRLRVDVHAGDSNA